MGMRRLRMQVNVCVWWLSFLMSMSVGVDSPPALSRYAQRCDHPEPDKHERNRNLHPQSDLVRDRSSQQQDYHAHCEQRGGVTESPKVPTSDRASNALVLTHNG
jgi:hypothetical protein